MRNAKFGIVSMLLSPSKTLCDTNIVVPNILSINELRNVEITDTR